MFPKSLASIFLLSVLHCCGVAGQINNEIVGIQTLWEGDANIRALELADGKVFFAGSQGFHGYIHLGNDSIECEVIKEGEAFPEFRAIAHNGDVTYILTAGNPALLYSVDQNLDSKLVYKEEGEGVFYDSMAFWDERNGIAIGDSMNGCLSIITTIDGGGTWQKTACEQLPKAVEGEGAFAASETNVVLKGNTGWIFTSKGRCYKTVDKGKNWKVFNTPANVKTDDLGIYSIDFYNDDLGYGIGGSWKEPELNTDNKVITTDGGHSWQSLASGSDPGYQSCVQFAPGSKGRKLVSCSKNGIYQSSDWGSSWTKLSDQGFYSFRFVNDRTAYASGKGILAKWEFR